MKQFQFLYHNSDELHRELYKIEQWRKSRVTSGVVFQIFSESLDRSLLDSICDVIRTAMTQRRTECTRLPGPLAGVCSPAHPEADSLGAQQLPHTRRLPSALLPSRDVSSWLAPAPACLGSLPQPHLRASSP